MPYKYLNWKKLYTTMNPNLAPLLVTGLGAELIYSFVIILCGLMIYFGTKELYELSSYKGIQYFRKSFLFFGIAFFFRYFIKIIFTIINPQEMLFMRLFPPLTTILFIYFSSIAIFYLLYSLLWKKWKFLKVSYLHLLSATISVISILIGNSLFYILINILFLLIALISLSIVYLRSNKISLKNKLYLAYILLFVFWILNIFDILIPSFFEKLQLVIYLSSIGIFFAIVYRVLKKAGSD